MKKQFKLVVLAAMSAFMVGCSNNTSSTGNPSSTFPVATDSTGKSDSTSSSSSSTDPSADDDDDDVVDPVVEKNVEVTGGQTGDLSKKGKFYTDYSSLAIEQQAAKETAIDIASEGDVLLKNADNALPLASSEKHVTCFGIATVDMVTAGGGSGAGTTGNNGVAFTGIQESLEDVGIQVNPSTIDLYKTYKTINGATKTADNNLLEISMDEYTSSTIASYYAYNDAAVITLHRAGAENKDLATCQVDGHKNEDDHYLMLDDNERELIKHVKTYFDKVIVLINSSNIMEIPELVEEKTSSNLGVDAVLWIGGVGNNGAMAVGKILTGEVNPSGHTSDIWTKNFKNDPSFTNFGWQNQNKNGDGSRMNATLYYNGEATNYTETEYREGIYNGYRFYETKATDMGKDGEGWYNNNVLYPFGFGLSYTTFDWKWVGVAKTATISGATQTVTAQVKVTNTGSLAGKDVVQIYFSAPYTKNGIEKASNNLVNFGKTKLLQPGESDIVTVQFVAQDMASFDYDDKNNNGHTGYELEAGDYTITANRDSHTPVLSMTRTINSTIEIQNDYVTGKEIKPIFSQDDEYKSTKEALENNTISRSDEGGLKQPTAASVADRTITKDEKDLLDDQDVYNHYELEEADPWYASSVPSTWTQDSKTTGENHLDLADMAGVDYQDLTVENGKVSEGTDAGSTKWTSFMNQLSWEDMANIVSGDAKSGPGMAALDVINKDEDNYKDGPVQIGGGTLFPSAPILSASFNTKLGEKMGRLVGNEAIFLGLSQWAGPAMNTHRSPFSGRNFEYYSQDGYHAARFAAAVVSGAVSKGLITYCKHFFLNDQESYRADYGGVLTFANEQVIREQYLKPFEYAVKFGHSMGIMSSFNRIGYAVTANSYAIHQYLLRDEWDSKADVCTDAWAKDYVPVNLMAYAGSDQLLGSSKGYPKNALDHGTWDASTKMVKTKSSATATSDDQANPSLYFAIRRKAQRALYARANSTTIKNGAVSGQKFTVIVEQGVNNNIKVSNSDISFVLDDASSAALAEYGLKFVNNKVVSGKPTKEGKIMLNATTKQDVWITSTAEIDVEVRSAIHVDGTAMTTGTSAASYTANQNFSMKVDIPALSYFTEVPGGAQFWGMSMNGLIVNAYQDSDDSWHQRNEDKTASDIITIDASTAKAKKEYDYSFANLPTGVKAVKHEKSVVGKANKGSYDVVDYYTIEGSLAAGTYTFDVDLTYYTNAYMSSWIFAGTPTEGHYKGSITFTVK